LVCVKGAALLEVVDISSYYGKLRILSNVSLSVGNKEIASLVGSNGAGKSTLLRTICGLVTPKSGKVEYEGERIEGLAVTEIVKRGIAIVLERRRLFTTMTVLENLEMGAYLRAKDPTLEKDLEMVYGLFPVLRKRSKQIAGTLSGGEQQMLAIGRAVVANPKLLLLDEPSLGLAPILVEEIFSVIQNLKHERSVLLVEQNAYMALRMADRAYVIETGKIVMSGNGHELLDNSHVKKAYLGM
jgi:branched-chain amino acid transport system ATP-binding protein